MKNPAARLDTSDTASKILEDVFSFLKVEWNGTRSAMPEKTNTSNELARSPRRERASERKLYPSSPALPSTMRIGVLDLDFRFRWVNERFCKFIGVSADDLRGKRINEAMSSRDKIECVKYMFAELREGEKWSGEMKTDSAKGDSVRMHINILPVRTTNGTIGSFVVYNSNMRVIREDADRTTISDAEYREMIENQSDIVVKTKSDGAISYANKSFCHLAGVAPEQIHNRDIKSILSRSMPEDFISMIFSLTTSVPELSGVFEIPQGNGKKIWVSWRAKGLFDFSGKLFEVLLIGRDVSELKSAELQKQSNMLDLERIAFITSHKVRGPIATMLGLVDLVEMGNVSSDEAREYLANLRSCIHKLDNCTRDLAAFIYGRQTSL